MYNKIVVGLIGLIIILGGVLLLGNQTITTKKVSSPANVSPTINLSIKQTTQETIITVTNSDFSPQTIKIKKGTRVVWINKSDKTVTVNSAVHPTHSVYPPLNLGEFGKNSSVQLVFEKQGTYKYHNHLNPAQTGTVVVE